MDILVFGAVKTILVVESIQHKYKHRFMYLFDSPDDEIVRKAFENH